MQNTATTAAHTTRKTLRDYATARMTVARVAELTGLSADDVIAFAQQVGNRAETLYRGTRAVGMGWTHYEDAHSILRSFEAAGAR